MHPTREVLVLAFCLLFLNPILAAQAPVDTTGSSVWTVPVPTDVPSWSAQTPHSPSGGLIPIEGLVAYYPFNGNADDQSGNGNHGSLIGGVTSTEDRFGNPGAAFDFNGTDGYITIPNSSSLQSPLSAVTVTGWARTEAWYNTWAVLMAKSNSTDRGQYGLAFTDGGRMEIDIANAVLSVYTGFLFQLGEWYFVAYSWNGNDVAAYINGSLIATATYDIMPQADAKPLELGRHTPGLTEYHNGQLDDIRIYDRVLSDEEIMELYNETPGDPLAQYGVVYGSTGSAEPDYPGWLLTVDLLTGAATPVGPTGIMGDAGPSVPSLAVKSTGEIYTMSASAFNAALYTIDASNGAATFLAFTGLSSPDGMAFNGGDVLYAIANSNNLYTVDVATGAPTWIGPTGFSTKDIAFDPTDGTLYGCSPLDQIYTIDPATGTSMLIGTTGLGGSSHAIFFDQEGNLFGSKGSMTTPYNLIAIDKETGAGTVVGPLGVTAVIGLGARLATSPVTVEVNIDSLYQFVPAEGDTFPYTMTFRNLSTATQVVDWWTKVIRPVGNPIDPLGGPEVLVLDGLETLVIDTAMVPVPFNARSGDYSLIAFVGRYLVDTLGTDTTSFHKLPAISCEDISRFQARCRPGGIMQARIILNTLSHTGDPVEFTIDDVAYNATVGSNGIAFLSLTGFNPGSHDVELTEPMDCYPPLTVTCPAGLEATGEEGWGDEVKEIPPTSTLLENYPNPFNPTTTIRYALSTDSHVTIRIYNMLGQLVTTLVDEAQKAGYKSVIWNGRNESGAAVSSGIYVYTMNAGAATTTKRMLLVK